MSDLYATADPVELRLLAEAWPEDIFPAPPEERQAKDAAAAHVLRRMAVPHFLACASEIEQLQARVAELEDGIREALERRKEGHEVGSTLRRCLAESAPLDASHDHGVAQKWCDKCGDCSCEVMVTTELDPVIELFITRRDETGCSLHDTSHDQDDRGADRE